MAAFARPGFCEKGHRIMSKKPRQATTSVTADNVPAPVRVRLRRISCDYARPYPPDGQAREWWQRLKKAFGTASSAFVDASLIQLIAAARLPNSGISEIAVNAMAVLAKLGGGHGSERRIAALGSAAARLLRAYATQVESLRRLRNGGSQFVRVEHVHVNEGGQAVIGNVRGATD